MKHARVCTCMHICMKKYTNFFHFKRFVAERFNCVYYLLHVPLGIQWCSTDNVNWFRETPNTSQECTWCLQQLQLKKKSERCINQKKCVPMFMLTTHGQQTRRKCHRPLLNPCYPTPSTLHKLRKDNSTKI
jgi:hypothetical protein